MTPASAYALRTFEQTRKELSASRTIEDFNQSLYWLATDANRIIDTLAENIIVLNTENIPQDFADIYIQSTQMLFSKLQTTFSIPAPAIEKAIKMRVQKIIMDVNLERQAALVRSPIGFDVLRKRSSPPGGEEDVEKVPMGFVKFRSSSDSESLVEKYPPGFVRFPKKTEDLPVEKAPMGFSILPPGESKTDSVGPKAPFGFVHFGKKPLTESSITKQIYLDLNTGYFEVQ